MSGIWDWGWHLNMFPRQYDNDIENRFHNPCNLMNKSVLWSCFAYALIKMVSFENVVRQIRSGLAVQDFCRPGARPEAWITSAVDEKCVNKAITLAGSLRRVQTSKKLVVLTTLEVREELREKLKEVFDLVFLLDPKTQNGWKLEDYTKIHGFSLGVFDKCVYLSPNALVLKNCDEIFGKYTTFAASQIGPNNDIDLSIYLFVPSIEYSKTLLKAPHHHNNACATGGNGFSQFFNVWLRNQTPNIENLEEKYNLKLRLKGEVQQSLNPNASIVNFVGAHPLDYDENSTKKMPDQIGPVERFAFEYCWKIYTENSHLDSANIWPNNQYKTEPIAIVGMSFRLPGGNNPDEFWSLLAEGRNAVVRVPSNRWTKENSYYPCKDPKVEAGFVNVPLEEFDGKFFALSPKEVELLDPQQRLLLEVTWEALEDAMIDPLSLRGSKTGVFVGSWVHDYKDICCQSMDVDFFRTYMGNSIAATAARISHFLETTGPSIATESACSSVIAAVDMACKSLRSGDSDTAVAAGVNLLLRPFEQPMIEFVLSPDYRCKTFDAEANGFARGEGCASILLKRLSDAVRDEDHIWGLIRGSALTQEGLSKSMGTPTVHCESLAMELALKDAGVHPKDVSYVEAHGTGTAVGDPMEISSITKAYSNGRTEPLIIGSVKTNVGHTEAVSGLTGIIKVLLSMKNEMIPKHLNLNTLNPNINLEVIPARIPMESMPWPRNDTKRRIAGVSSFGISGTDGHAIIEEPPQLSQPKMEFDLERPVHIMKLSTKSKESMDELVQKYQNLFQEKNDESEQDFANIAYSANIGRATFNDRAVIVAKNMKDAAKILQDKSFKQADVQVASQNLCFLFTGQGSQYPGMGKQLYETSPIFRDCFDKCDKVLQKRYNISIRDVLWSSDEKSKDLSRTLYSQTSIFVMEYCLLKLWESWGIKPDFVMGHSLGEFAAAVAAGALYFEDALMLVAERSRLIDSLPQGKMLVIKADKKTVDKRISEFRKINPQFWVDYAALNSPDQTVVAGDSGMIEAFGEFCTRKSLKTIILAATHAFHSRHMEPMLDAYKKVASTVKTPEVRKNLPKYISGMEGKLMGVDEIDANYWVKHTREKVSFMDACKVAKEDGCTLFLEIGPHPVLSALTMMNMEGSNQQIRCLPSIRKKEDEWVTILDTLSKLYLSEWKGEIDWRGFDRFYSREKVKLPFYPFNRKPTWAKFEKNYSKVHPLIGSIMPTALGGTIFQSSLTLKNTNFIEDHVIGNTTIFPGAGFLEMCLAGGHSAVQGFTEEFVKPRRPILVKFLKIASPLAIYESKTCKLQTVITLNDKGDDDTELGYSVEVHQQSETNNDGTSTGHWILHASAKFLPVAPSLSSKAIGSHDIIQMLSTWEKSDTKNFYQRLPEVGLRFGPKFQSLECTWKSENGLLASIKVPNDYCRYLIHPLVADAMIQVLMLWTSLSSGNVKKKLQIPVMINEFVWLKEPQTSNLYALCSIDENNKTFCALVDETGTTYAVMKGVEFIETTAKLVEGMITQQSVAMPKLWKEVWKTSRGPLQGCLTHEISGKEQDFSSDELNHFEEINTFSPDQLNFYNNLVNITRLGILNALYKLGWKPELDQKFSVNSVMKTLQIKDNFKQYIRFFLRSMALEECGLLKSMDEEENTFQFIKHPPTQEEIELGLKYITSSNDTKDEEYRLIKELESELHKILIGQLDPLSILFPTDSAKPSAGKFYQSIASKGSNAPLAIKCEKHLTLSVEQYSLKNQNQSRPTYRLLEVGAGTGVLTKPFISGLIERVKDQCDFEFYITDISPAFFIAAEKNLQDYMKYIKFKKYDMEKDPLEQGFCPDYFDLICATEVFHIAKDVKKTMKMVRSILKPGGLLLFAETIYPDERTTFCFGLLDGYWQFEDREFRKNHVTLTPNMWEETLINAGFYQIRVIPSYNNRHGIITAHAAHMENNFLKSVSPAKHSWIIFGEHDDLTEQISKKFIYVNRKAFVFPQPKSERFEEATMQEYLKKAIASASGSSEGENLIEGILYLWSLRPNTRDQTRISLPLVTLMKLVSEFKKAAKVFVVVQGAHAMESFDVIDPTPGTIIGFCKSLLNEIVGVNIQCLDLDPNKNLLDQQNDLFMNLWVEHHISAAFRNGERFVSKLTTGKILRNESLSLPSGCDRFQLVIPKTKLISDLEFATLEPYELGENEVEIKVKATALNFRDVFAVLKPIKQFEKLNAIGLDVSGIVGRVGGKVTKFKVGDRVIGMNMTKNLSLPSHVKSSENLIAPLPHTMTFAEGVTLPAVFSTAIYCLIYIGKMKKGENVLIHTASGGVGLVAIQICTSVGANVIATAGSQRKRTYLRNLGIKHVFNSRTTDFKKEILEITEGRGVDIVLNSLTGPGFKEASLDVLTKNGRFIEMSKLNVWTPEEVRTLRPDAFYELFDLTETERHEQEKLMCEFLNFMKSEFIKPIAYERFDALNIRGALNYLQKAKHIGKIVCIMPEVRMEKSRLIATTPLFNEDSTYMVTGGLGGIGFEVVKWMLGNGAKHIAIVSRSSPKPEIAGQIEKWNKSGKHVQAFSVDIGNYEKCKELFEELKKPELGFPQLRGVMHAAGTLKDGILENQSWDTFHHTYNPKVSGSWNLHDLTRDYLLEHFVLFSSIAAIFGSPAQTNHSASNAFEDSLAAYRNSIGLPATSINWGNWGEVGVATEVDFPGVRPISTSQGLLALETFLRTQTTHMAVVNIDSFALLSKLFPVLKNYIDDTRLLGDSKGSVILNCDEFWKQVDSAQNKEGKMECFMNCIKTIARNILKMDADEPISNQTEFQTLGIDSLMMLEMKNGIQNVLGSRMTLTANQLKDCNNTEALATRLVDILEGELDNDGNNLSHEELKQLIRDDSNLLPDNLSTENLELKSIDQVETVLLTGANGNLGPYLLSNLVGRQQIKKVYCLIRPIGSTSGEERLKRRLEEVKLSDTIDFTKIEVIEGDITTPKFGLDEIFYNNLCDSVDAIIHNAVKADHTAKYWKAPETKRNHVRTVNVLGTLRVLKFAAEKKVKHCFYSSSMVAYTGTGKSGEPESESEGWQDVSAFDSLKSAGSSGYTISKHISEQLVYKAIGKGIPCKAFRFPLITGDSKTGRVEYIRNHLMLRWLTCMKIGMIHDLPTPIATLPVDHCAKISLDIFFNPNAPNDVYNMVAKNIAVEQVIVEVAQQFGVEIKTVSYHEFVEMLKVEGKNENSPIAPFTKFFVESESEFIENFENPSIKVLKQFLENSENFISTLKLSKYAPEYDQIVENTNQMLNRDFEYLKKEGVFEKFDIKYDNNSNW